MMSENNRWFAEEVHPHEPALRAYLKAQFPTFMDQDDLVQETYTRLLRAKEVEPIRSARAFLFTTARNVAIDLIRRHRSRPMQEMTEAVESHAMKEGGSSAAEIVAREQEIALLNQVVEELPSRCREIMVLRYRESLSYQEIAVRLNVSLDTVKTQLARGMRRCVEGFAANGLIDAAGNNVSR